MSVNTVSQPTLDRLDNLLADRELVVASNRQPYSHDVDEHGNPSVSKPTGGLTAALDPVMRHVGGTWVAWGSGDRDFRVADGTEYLPVPPENPSYRLRRLRLTDEQIRDYYYGFSNQVLWPVCHSSLTNVRCDAGFWDRYSEVNEHFARSVVDQANERSLIWFQDYHLALAPIFTRQYVGDVTDIMHYWHIPWPSWDTFRACPNRRALIEGLLGSDLIGFHVPRYRTNFLECADAALDKATVDWEAGSVIHSWGVTNVEVTPLGVQSDQIQEDPSRSTTESFWPSFVREHRIKPGNQIAVGVDRFDYTKGIKERLRALKQLFTSRPRWRGELTYIQNGSKSRSEIPAYREVQADIESLIDRINDRFRTNDWQPIVHITERLTREELIELYAHASTALVTSIRDGMNLVAQEYVAAQADGDGVLLLSDQAGIHDEIGKFAVTVNPFDTESIAEAIDYGLSLSSQERKYRMNQLRRWVKEHTLDRWLESNIRAVRRETPSDGTANQSSLPI